MDGAALTLLGTALTLNRAEVEGGALLLTGGATLSLGNGSYLKANKAPLGSTAQVLPGSSWQYGLPAPQGHWVANGVPCVAAQACGPFYGQTVSQLAVGPLRPQVLPPSTRRDRRVS